MGNGSEPQDCTGSLCGYGVASGRIGCQSGDGSCWSASIIEAKQSNFHTADLEKATRDIRAILDGIPSPGEGLTLSFVHTRMGTILAWVAHGEPYPSGTITWSNTDAEIAEALGLILDQPRAA
ncbi:MAG: hypothetical protein ABIU09_10200 [Pyrinomonadaceae bacterium]